MCHEKIFFKKASRIFLGHYKIQCVSPIMTLHQWNPFIIIDKKILISNQDNLFLLDSEKYITDHILLSPSIGWKLRIHLLIYSVFTYHICTFYFRSCYVPSTGKETLNMTCSCGTFILVGMETGKKRHETNKQQNT